MLYAVSPPGTKILKVERRGDGLWLSSEFGIHRLSPKNARCIRVSFTREEDFSVNPRPGVLEREDYKDWDFEVTDEEIVLRTEEITLKINRNTASYRWFDKNGKLLLQETEKDSRSLEKFDVLKTISAKTEKVLTADGEKEVVKESSSEVAGHCWHSRLNLKFQDKEELYGLGQHEEGFGSLRGNMVYLHQANKKIALPMLVSSIGYGILTDTYSPMIFSDTPYGSYIYSEAVPEMEYYFMYGGDMRGVIAQYRFLTGKAAMLPRWAFGYIQSQERYENQDEIEHTVKEYRERGIGLDCIVLDWCSWEDGKWGQKTLDDSRFPEPKKMIDRLHEDHVKFMISIWANTNEDTDNYAELEEAGLLLQGCSVYDAFSAEGRAMYWEQAKRGLYTYGVDAWWCDNSEPFNPEWIHNELTEPAKMYEEYCRYVRNHMPVEKSNAYGFYHAMGIYEGQRAENDGKRVVNLTRSAYTGQQRFGAVLWSGDVSATWDTLKRQIAAGLNFCASGMPYWTTDIGAFFVKRGAPWYWRGDFDRCFDDLGYRELFTRWYQWAVFLPVFRGHGTDCRRELWHCANDDVPFYDVIIKMNRMRYELMPYIYSAAANCWIKDGTIMLPLAFDYPDDTIANKITDQYMFGDSLMVCPVTEPMYYLPGSKKMEAEKTRKVYLPKGGWYDYYTNVYYKGGKYITVDAPIDKIPLFVREGSVIPVSKSAGSTEELSGEIKLRVYAGHDAVYYLYEDAFDGYGYERGEYRITRIRWHEREHKIDVESETPDQNAENNGKYRYQIVQEDTEVFCQGCI